MKSEYHSKSAAYPRAIVAGAVLAVAVATLPVTAFADAEYGAFAFASLAVTPADDIDPAGGSVDVNDSYDLTKGNAEATIALENVEANDFGTQHQVGVHGLAGPSLTGYSYSEAGVSSLTSLEFEPTGDSPSIASIDWVLNYSVDLYALIGDSVFDTASAGALLQLFALDFSTGADQLLFELDEFLWDDENFEIWDEAKGTIDVPVGGLGFQLVVDVYGQAISTQVVPVPAALVLFCSGFAGLLGMGLRRRTAGRLNA